MNSPSENSAPQTVNKKHMAVMALVLASLSAVLEPKNPHDPTGQTGFKFRGGTKTQLDHGSAKAKEEVKVEVKGNFGQDVGY